MTTARAGLYPVIAIDGGAGTGKTTSAARVAGRLGFCYVDSGAAYRAVALALAEAGIEDPADPRLAAALASIHLRLEPEPARFSVYLGEREVSGEIRTPRISNLSSMFAVCAEVRDRVTRLLREARRKGPMVVEGRDIGTAVFPDASLKVYLVASLPVRAERRRLDLLAQGVDQPAERVQRDLAERDHRDSTRTEAPLAKAEGAIEIDTGNASIDGQVEEILRAWERVQRK